MLHLWVKRKVVVANSQLLSCSEFDLLSHAMLILAMRWFSSSNQQTHMNMTRSDPKFRDGPGLVLYVAVKNAHVLRHGHYELHAVET